MPAVSLTTLIARAAAAADESIDGFVPTSEWTQFLNASLTELYDLLVAAFDEDYFESTSALTTVAGTSDYALPESFYKLLGVSLTTGGRLTPLKRYARADRGALSSPLSNGALPRYRLVGTSLRLLPAPASVMTGTIYYVPQLTALASGADTVTLPAGWEEFAVLGAAIAARIKGESDVADLVLKQDKMRARLVLMAEDRDVGAPAQVVDADLAALDFDGDAF